MRVELKNRSHNAQRHSNTFDLDRDLSREPHEKGSSTSRRIRFNSQESLQGQKQRVVQSAHLHSFVPFHVLKDWLLLFVFILFSFLQIQSHQT